MSAAYLLGSLIFSGIGFVAMVYGKKMGLWKTAATGALLFAYSYFSADLLYVYGVGIALTCALFFFKE